MFIYNKFFSVADSDESVSDIWCFGEDGCSTKDKCVEVGPSPHYYNVRSPRVHLKDDFDLGAALLSRYDILEEIFNYLQFSDLKTLSLLSDEWRSKLQRFYRKVLTPMLYSFSKEVTYVKDDGLLFTQPMFGVVFFNSDKETELGLEDFVCVHNSFNSSTVKKRG